MIVYEAQINYVRKEITGILLDNPERIYKHAKEFLQSYDPTIEHCLVIGINVRGYAVFTKVITTGTDKNCLISPRQILKECLINNAPSFVICHNHPSGDPLPSAADQKMTRQVREAAQIMDISFLDHVIIGEAQNDTANLLGYYSMREAGII